MMKNMRRPAAIVFGALSMSFAACGGGDQQKTAGGEVGSPAAAPTAAQPADSAPAPHHSKLAGAVVGGIVGHELGHHALAGAAAGALIQHHRNRARH